MMEAEILNNLSNKVDTNIETSSDEVIELKEDVDNAFRNGLWIIILILFAFFMNNKGDEEECTETTTDTIIQQEV